MANASAGAENNLIFSAPVRSVIVLDTHGIDTNSIHVLDAEASERTCRMVEVHNGVYRVRIVLGVLDSRHIVLRTELGNKRRVSSAESNRRGAANLAVRDTNPTGVKNAVHERGAVDDVGRHVKEDRTRNAGAIDAEVGRTGGGGVL